MKRVGEGRGGGGINKGVGEGGRKGEGECSKDQNRQRGKDENRDKRRVHTTPPRAHGVKVPRPQTLKHCSSPWKLRCPICTQLQQKQVGEWQLAVRKRQRLKPLHRKSLWKTSKTPKMRWRNRFVMTVRWIPAIANCLRRRNSEPLPDCRCTYDFHRLRVSS